jgi:tripartite ATP-independent transporter DctM subunit
MIVFAVLSETSVGKLFVAGIVPGALTGAALMVMAYIISRRRGYPREASASARRVLSTGWRALPALVAPVIIVGGVLGGVFTATEAGTVAAAYCFLVGKFVLRELTWHMCWRALVKAAIGTSTVLVILGSATIFAWIVADLQVSRHMAELMFAISREPWAFLLMLNICLLVVGLFLEPLPAMIIMVPIFFPIAADLGIDPIHFGLIVVFNLMIGLCTPPVGVLIYMSAALAETSPERVIRESLPFIGMLMLVLLLVTYVPALTLTLANLAYPS